MPSILLARATAIVTGEVTKGEGANERWREDRRIKTDNNGMVLGTDTAFDKHQCHVYY